MEGCGRSGSPWNENILLKALDAPPPRCLEWFLRFFRLFSVLETNGTLKK
jgi:hypothetical protein